MNTRTDRPPLYTALIALTGWTLDRTATLPRSHRFTFGERVDRLALDCLELVIVAIYSSPAEKIGPLHQLNLNLEKLRVFWRLIRERAWISDGQLLHITLALDEIGRMTGGWLKRLERAQTGRDLQR